MNAPVGVTSVKVRYDKYYAPKQKKKNSECVFSRRTFECLSATYIL